MWPFRKSDWRKKQKYHFRPNGCTWWPDWFLRDRRCVCNFHDALLFRIDHDDPDWREQVARAHILFRERLADVYEGCFWQHSAAIAYFGVSQFGKWFKKSRTQAECEALFGERWIHTAWARLWAMDEERLFEHVEKYYC